MVACGATFASGSGDPVSKEGTQSPLARRAASRHFSRRERGMMATSRKGEGKMATFDKLITFDELIQEISARYHLGPKGRSLIEETVDLIARQPGGVSGFLERFKAAGFAAEVASWVAGTDDAVP